MATNYLDDLVEKAKKILGDGAKVPNPKGDLSKAFADMSKAADEYQKTRDVLEAKILDIDNTAGVCVNILKQNSDQYAKEDFGLDSKKKEDAKKIKDAHALFDDIKRLLKVYSDHLKVVDELDKHCMQLGKYQSPKTK